MKDKRMQDFITITCDLCGQPFSIDREVHNSCGPDVDKKPFSFSFAGHIAQDAFSMMVTPKNNMCIPCCLVVAQRAVVLWAENEKVELPPFLQDQNDDYEEDTQISEVVNSLTWDFNRQRNLFVGVIVLQLFLHFIFGIAAIFI